KSFEAALMRRADYRVTTSQAMANALSEAYGASPPTVIYNAFPFAERAQMDGQVKDRVDRNLPSLHWFSQTIGEGRVLETLFDSLTLISTAVEIHLRGKSNERTREWIDRMTPASWRERIYIHPTVPNAELLSRIAEHDVGLALETASIRSRDLTITNKLFQYL